MADPRASFTLIKAARLIDGLGGPPLEQGAVLLEGDRIRAVGPEKSVLPPEGAEVQEIDYGKRTVLPGLIDCHVHLIGIGDSRVGDELTTLPDEVLTLQAARNARTHLYSGVTTVRDCGAKHQTTFMLRRAMEMGITPGSRLVLAGRPMAIIGGHLSYFGIQATGVNECRADVRQLIKEGADYIKITASGGSTRTSIGNRPSFDVDELTAICDEAHKFGKHVAAHCTNSEAIVRCLDAGVDTIIHGGYREPDGTYKDRPEITERLATGGVFVNPTLAQGRQRYRKLEQKMHSDGLTEEEAAVLNEFNTRRETGLEHVSRQFAGGVRLVCGSDSAWAQYTMGGFQYEIEAHVDVGMTPMAAILSATSDSARSCWTDDEMGSLEPGKKADVLVVDGDPSTDIEALRNLVDVFQDGILVDRGNYAWGDEGAS